MLLVVNGSGVEIEKAVMSASEKYARHPKVKSRNLTGTSFDLVVELRTDKGGELLAKYYWGKLQTLYPID